MEKPLYPSKFMRITQGFGEGSHMGGYAIDEAGKDTGIDNLYAPFTGMIKKIYQSDANEIWFESIDRVEYPDGTIDYMNILMAHDNDITDLYIGKVIKQGEQLYQEGTKGIATGNHCHFECGLGKFSGSGWYKNTYGNWVIKNGKNPTECLWINDEITILDSHGYTFRKIEPKVPEPEEVKEENQGTTPPIEEKEPEQEEIEDKEENNTPPKENEENKEENNKLPIEEEKTENPKEETETKQDIKLIFTCEKDDLYAIRLKKGQNLYLKK